MSLDLDDILFSQNVGHQRQQQSQQIESKQGDELKRIIDNIPYPGVDITMTTYSDFSDNTPARKQLFQQRNDQSSNQQHNLGRYLNQISQQPSTFKHHEKQSSMPSNYFFIEDNSHHSDEKNQSKSQSPTTIRGAVFQGSASQGSYMESMTPQRINHIVDWSRSHVTPGDSKNIFPQVIAPSIEFSNDNSVSLNVNSLQQNQNRPPQKNRLPDSPQFSGGKANWEKQRRVMESEIGALKRTLRKYESESSEMSDKLLDLEEHIRMLQEKYKDSSSLEQMRGRILEQSKQQLKQLRFQIESKSTQMIDQQNELDKLKENQKYSQIAMEKELIELHDKLNISQSLIPSLKAQYNESQLQNQRIQGDHQSQMNEVATIITQHKQTIEQLQSQLKQKSTMAAQFDKAFEESKQQILGLQSDLDQEKQCRKRELEQMKKFKDREELFLQQDNSQPQQLQSGALEQLQQEYITQKKAMAKLKEQMMDQQPQNCSSCKLCFQELEQMLQECNLNDLSQQLFQSDLQLYSQVREVTTLLLTKQREQIDLAIEQYEQQHNEMNERIAYFKNQNDEVIEENNRIQDQIQTIIQQKEEHEQKLWQHLDLLKNENLQLKINNDNETKKSNMYEHIQDTFQEDLSQKENFLRDQILEVKQQNSQITRENDHLKKEIQQHKSQISQVMSEFDSLQRVSKERESSHKKNQRNRENLNKTIIQMAEEKHKLMERLEEVEAQTESVKQLDDRNFQIERQLKDKDRKNIDLYNQLKVAQQNTKSLEDQIKFYKDETEKHQKQMIYKNTQIKALMEQVKALQDKNIELSSRLNQLSQQIAQFEEEFHVNSVDMRPDHDYVIQLQDQVAQYQQEFLTLKKVLQERLDKLSKEDKENADLRKAVKQFEDSNQTLLKENIQLKVNLQSKEDSYSRTNEIYNRKTLNEEEYPQNIFKDHMPTIAQCPSLSELLQPEMLSIEDTVNLIREVLRRAVRSVDVMRAVIEVQEIRELLSVVVHIENRMLEAEQSEEVINSIFKLKEFQYELQQEKQIIELYYSQFQCKIYNGFRAIKKEAELYQPWVEAQLEKSRGIYSS